MFEEMKQQVEDWNDDDQVSAYLTKLLHKEAFDHAGLIYGHGPRRVQPVRPSGTGVQAVCETALGRNRAWKRSTSSTKTWSGWLPRSSPRSGRSTKGFRQRGLLQRLCVPDAGPAPGTVHPHLCHRPDCGMERPPAGRTVQPGQDHPPGLHERPAPAGNTVPCLSGPKIKPYPVFLLFPGGNAGFLFPCP